MRKFLLGAALALLCGPALAAPGTGNPVLDQLTVTASAYANGNCFGGLQTIKVGPGASVLSAVELVSKGGLVQTKTLYFFFQNPSSSTCTDKGTFTLASADVLKELGSPFTLTPATANGATSTTATQLGLSLAIPQGGIIYLMIVDGGTETPGSTSDSAVIVHVY
jgi:hypothetical protein